jgi:hypothetical protein
MHSIIYPHGRTVTSQNKKTCHMCHGTATTHARLSKTYAAKASKTTPCRHASISITSVVKKEHTANVRCGLFAFKDPADSRPNSLLIQFCSSNLSMEPSHTKIPSILLPVPPISKGPLWSSQPYCLNWWFFLSFFVAFLIVC